MHKEQSRVGLEHLAHQLYLNTARDADFARRDRARQALAQWRRPMSETARANAAHALTAAAAEYGLRLRVERPF